MLRSVHTSDITNKVMVHVSSLRVEFQSGRYIMPSRVLRLFIRGRGPEGPGRPGASRFPGGGMPYGGRGSPIPGAGPMPGPIRWAGWPGRPIIGGREPDGDRPGGAFIGG